MVVKRIKVHSVFRLSGSSLEADGTSVFGWLENHCVSTLSRWFSVLRSDHSHPASIRQWVPGYLNVPPRRWPVSTGPDRAFWMIRRPTNSVYYLKYADNRLFSANGHEVGHIDNLPIQHGQSDVVYDGKATGVRAWVWDIALDDMGNPVIAYTLLPRESDHRYAYARWTGKRWLDVELTSGGKWFPQTPEGENEREPHYSGGMCLDHSNPSCVYLSRQINGVFEIEKWLSLDKGKTWMSQPITKNSDSLNVRPVVPRGYSGEKNHVLWMNGRYIHYTNYGTAIRMVVQ